MPAGPVVLTVGHSNRAIDAFLELLRPNRVSLLLDVRTLPRSRRNPQFGADRLAAALAAIGIAYEHVPELGGLRRPRADSPNRGWRDAAFRGFADHMASEGFGAALERVLARAHERRAALMCAEAQPARCHRWLIADALAARGAR